MRQLTKREQQVHEMIERGVHRNAIAAALGIGREHVSDLASQVRKKLGLPPVNTRGKKKYYPKTFTMLPNGTRVVLVRGRVSQKYNPRAIWLAATREHRTAKARQWCKNHKRMLQRAKARRREQDKRLQAKWEKDNWARRNSPRRRLFNKLRHGGISIAEARAQSGWHTAAG